MLSHCVDKSRHSLDTLMIALVFKDRFMYVMRTYISIKVVTDVNICLIARHKMLVTQEWVIHCVDTYRHV